MNRTTKAAGLASAAVIGLCAAGQTASRAPGHEAKVASTLVKTCANIESSNLVLIEGGVTDHALLEEIALEVRKLGAHPLITCGSDRLMRRMYTDVPDRFDTQEPTFALRLAEIVDAVISVEFQEKPDLLADIAPQRITDQTRAREAVYRAMLEKGVVQVNLGNNLTPTQARAQQFGIPRDQLATIFWKAVDTDYARLQQTGQRIQNVLASARELRITAPNGTDLTVQIAERPVFVSDGVVSREERYAGGPSCQVWLPAGEVYLAPVPGTAKGTFVADTYFYEGQRIDGLTMKFNAGKLTSLSAKSDMTTLQKRYDAAPPGRDAFAAVDIGINPDVEIPARSSMVTWMAAGTVSVGIGNNEWAGGDNSVPFDVFAHLTSGTVTVDGTRIVENGKLVTTGR
jgi:leucyl aminopeptidase (aminopeptidase T)